MLKERVSVKKRSKQFYPGQRIEGTMLTIIDSVDPLSWRMIRCVCDCGNKLTLSYIRVYAGQFSCGCKRKLRVDAIDHTGLVIVSKSGNLRSGRTLTVLDRDPDTQQWRYICDCCSEVFIVPRGYERGLVSTLKQIASERCPKFLQFFPVVPESDVVVLVNHITEHGGALKLGSTTWRARINELANRYAPEHVKRDRKGVVIGFYGYPKILPEDRERRRNMETVAYGPLPIDPDGFGDI